MYSAQIRSSRTFLQKQIPSSQQGRTRLRPSSQYQPGIELARPYERLDAFQRLAQAVTQFNSFTYPPKNEPKTNPRSIPRRLLGHNVFCLRSSRHAQRHHHHGGRSGLSGPRLLRVAQDQDSSYRPDGQGRHALHRLLFGCCGLHAFASFAFDRLLCEAGRGIRRSFPS